MEITDAVCVELKGGLGNQLFQYAAGRALSMRLSCRLALDVSAFALSRPGDTQRTFMLDRFAIIGEMLQASEDLPWSDYVQPTYSFDPSFDALGTGTRLRGYFQSELFFASIRNTIRKDLRLTIPLSPAAQSISDQIRSTNQPISLHVRRGDFIDDPATAIYHGVCDQFYYERAIRILTGLLGQSSTIFVFSDDRQTAEQMLGREPPFLICRTPADRPWEDLILMAQCHHHVTANSSFSWWGAWLNQRAQKFVVAPRFWVSREAQRDLNTTDLHPDGTILV